MEDEAQIWQVIISFFRSRWTNFTGNLAAFDTPPMDVVSPSENRSLLLSIFEDEIRSVLYLLPEDKAPGPNGFLPSFFRQFWFVIHGDVVAAVQEFFMSAQIPDSWRKAFVPLIPKWTNASELSHFRPIS